MQVELTRERTIVDQHRSGPSLRTAGIADYRLFLRGPYRATMLERSWRWLMIACGILALGLGILGILLPLLPTTPFVLLAAFFFSKGSERLHHWLLDHPRFGHYIRDWEAEQVVPPIGKYASTLTMVPLVSWAILTRDIPCVLELMMVATVVGTLWFIWTRPSRRSAPVTKSETTSSLRNQ